MMANLVKSLRRLLRQLPPDLAALLELGPVAYKKERGGTDYLIHFLKLYIDAEAEANTKYAMPRLSLTPEADDAKNAIMADARFPLCEEENQLESNRRRN